MKKNFGSNGCLGTLNVVRAFAGKMNGKLYN